MMIPRGCDYASVAAGAGANALVRSHALHIRSEAVLARGPW